MKDYYPSTERTSSPAADTNRSKGSPSHPDWEDQNYKRAAEYLSKERDDSSEARRSKKHKKSKKKKKSKDKDRHRESR